MMPTSSVIRMPQRFDYSSGPEFNQAMSSQPFGHNIVLDCSDMDYIDSAGLGLLLIAHHRLQDSDTRIMLCGLKATPRKIIEMANIQEYIDIE